MNAAFYSLTTGWLYGVTVFDPKTERLRDARPGEAVLQIDDALFAQWQATWQGGGDRDPIQEFLNTVTGITGAPAEFAVVLNGVVVNVMYVFDPVICANDMAQTVAEVPGAVSIAILPSMFPIDPNTGKQSDVAFGATFQNGIFTNPVQPVIVKQGGK